MAMTEDCLTLQIVTEAVLSQSALYLFFYAGVVNIFKRENVDTRCRAIYLHARCITGMAVLMVTSAIMPSFSHTFFSYYEIPGWVIAVEAVSAALIMFFAGKETATHSKYTWFYLCRVVLLFSIIAGFACYLFFENLLLALAIMMAVIAYISVSFFESSHPSGASSQFIAGLTASLLLLIATIAVSTIMIKNHRMHILTDAWTKVNAVQASVTAFKDLSTATSRLLAGYPDIVNSASKMAQPADMHWLSVTGKQLEVAYLMDLAGDVFFSTDYTFYGKNYAFRPYFKGAITGTSTFYMARGVTSGKYGAYIASPVYVEGAIIAVLVLKYEINQILSRFTPYTVIHDKNWFVVVGPPDLAEKFIISPSEQTLKCVSLERNISEIKSACYRQQCDMLVADDGTAFKIVSSPITGCDLIASQLIPLRELHGMNLALLVSYLAIGMMLIILCIKFLASTIYSVSLKREMQAKLIAETENQKVREQLVQYQKLQAIGALAAGIAHDFNNILMAISGNVELCRIRLLKAGIDASLLDNALASTQKASGVVGQLLIFSRKHVLKKEPIQLSDSIANMLHMLKRFIGENIAIDFTPVPALPCVLADHSSIDQLIMNFVVNARDAMPHGGTITISCRYVDRKKAWDFKCQHDHAVDMTLASSGCIPSSSEEINRDGYVIITVADTGTGMTQDIASRVFEPFFTTKEQEKGTGLGLAIINGIVEKHKGFVCLQSKLSKGTSFHVFLPACQSEMSCKQQDRLLLHGSEVPAVGHALLMDDDADVQAVVYEYLNNLDIPTSTVSSLADAQNIMERSGGNIGLLVSDIILSDGNGIDFVRHCRKHHPSLLVVLMSGYADRLFAEMEQITQEGFVSIAKPFTALELTEAIIKAQALMDISKSSSAFSSAEYLPEISRTQNCCRCILLVEDDVSIRDTTEAFLTENGYHIMACGTGEEAMELFEKTSSSMVLITDINLPGMTGLELAEKLRVKNNELPVIFCSGYIDNKDNILQKFGKNTMLLPKPYKILTLLECVQTMSRIMSP